MMSRWISGARNASRRILRSYGDSGAASTLGSPRSRSVIRCAFLSAAMKVRIGICDTPGAGGYQLTSTTQRQGKRHVDRDPRPGLVKDALTGQEAEGQLCRAGSGLDNQPVVGEPNGSDRKQWLFATTEPAADRFA